MTGSADHPVDRLGRSSSPVFVGRGAELARLVEVTASPPALVLVEGEPGVGKTRLVQELTNHHESAGVRTLLGRCHELSEPFPLGPLVEALRATTPSGPLPAVTGALRGLLPELGNRLPEAPAPLHDPVAERHRQFRGLLELLTSFGRGVLIVEDLHWADQATLEFLRFLVVQPPPQLAIVGTYRREDLPPGSPLLRLDAQLPAQSAADRIALAPLAESELRDLVRIILQTPHVSAAFAAYLFEHTAGLPLAVEELLLLLRQRRDLVFQRGEWIRQQLDTMTVPPKLRDAIIERLSRVGPQARALVQAAAVLSVPVNEQVLARVAGMTDLECVDALTEALAAALLLETDSGRYAFRHALARQAVAESVPSPARRRLHLRAARALEAEPDRPLARLARHYRAAGQTMRWLHYAEAAADRAVSFNDHASAYALLRDAVSIEGLTPVTRGRLAIKVGRHAARCHAYGDAIALLTPLLDSEAIPVRARGEIRFLTSRLRYDTGDCQTAQVEAIRALDELDEPASAQVMAWLAMTPNNTDPAWRTRWLDRAMTIASRSTDRPMRMEIAASRAMLLVRAGDPGCWQAIEEFPEPDGSPLEIEQAIRGYGNFADVLLYVGYDSAAAELNHRAMQLAREHSPSFVVNCEITGMQLDWLAGRYRGLEERLRDEIAAAEDWPSARESCESFLGLLLLATGRTTEALHLLGPLSEQMRSDVRMLTWVVAALGQWHLAEGRPDAAGAVIEPALRATEENDMWLSSGDLVAVAVQAQLAAGHPGDAGQLVARFADEVRGRDAPAASASLATCRGLLAEWDQRSVDAADLFEQADQAWRVMPRPQAAAAARSHAGRCLMAVDVERGQRLLLDALATFGDIGAAWHATLVRQTLRRNGLIAPHRRGRRSYGNELSPREAEVARLAAQGLQNREIAGTLHLSVKTVEGHLSAASRKLGASPRSGMALAGE